MILDIIKDNKRDINKILKEHDNVTILYHSYMCGYCLKLMPVWKRISKKYEKSRNIIIVNVEANNMEYLHKKFKKDIIGFPTILKYKKGKLIEEYDGNRKTKSLNMFIAK